MKDLSKFFKTPKEISNTLIIDDSQKAWIERDQNRILFSKKFAPFHWHDSSLTKFESTPNGLSCMVIDQF